ncbi:hypothetical protein ACSBR1_011538 [Camellia fascicularis]
MGAADMLIYLLRPKSTPISLSTRGAAIPSVCTNLAEHHLTKLPAHSIGSSAAGQQLLGSRAAAARQPGSSFSAINGRAMQLARALRSPN